MLRFLSKSKIREKWSFTSDSLIWRILYEEPHCIIGECRDAERKIASFFSLDAASGSAYWHAKQFAEPWWIGIEGVENGLVFFHGYAKPDMPEHKGIEACSIVSGRTLWSNPNFVFWFSCGDKICAYRDFFEKRVSYLLNAQSGEILEEDIDARALRHLKEESDVQPGAQFPEPLEGSVDIKQVSDLLGKKWNNILPETIEFLENTEYWIIGFYIREEGRNWVSPHLGIVEKKTGDIAYSIKLGEHYPVPVPGLFFKVRENIYYIESQHSLHAVELWKS